MFRSCALTVALLLAAASPGRAQDAADIVVRLNRVEGQMRTLSGQVEQLQYENRQLKEQLRKFQEDTEFRFQERGGRSAAPRGGTPAPPPGRRSDAFDPATDPGAPGAPRTLGGGASDPPPPVALPPSRRSAVAEEDEDAPGRRPFDLGAAARGGQGAGGQGSGGQSSGGQASGGSPRGPEPEETARLPSAIPAGTDDPRADYDVAYAFLIQREYDRAESAFQGFLQAHPRDRLAPDATYWLGESYLRRNRPREAAAQFLKVTTEYAKSAKAPDAFLKLGMSLSALGAKDQACATFAELERRFPGASASVRQGVDREQKRARCTA